ncbi:MAG: long-chain-fatty-acid--CoA ligase [Rhodocyclales bacterium]|nr:long-chain-fatty-acid--CoA ligase [Rhodocyclales bacterium]
MDISEWIGRHAVATPAKTAIRYGGRDLSYRDFADLVDRTAAALAAAGVRRGGCAAFLGCNSPEMLALFFACARLGALFMPLNWRLAGPEHQQMLDDCPPGVLVVEAPFLAQTDAYRKELGAMRLVALGSGAAGWQAWEDFLAAGSAVPADPAVGPDAPLLICYTSGSTGKPKGVVLTQDAIACNADNSADMHVFSPDDRVLTVLPLFHVGGLNIQTTPALRAGCTLVLHPRFDPEAALEAIERERITLVLTVPAVVDMMMASPRWPSTDLSSLRMMSIGSSIVPLRMIEAVHARGVPMTQVYGATETCPIVACLKRDEAYRKIGSTGRAALHCRLRIVGNDGADLPPRQAGEILVRGRNLFAGYWRNPEATAAAMDNGWYRTGDMGWLDDEGFLTVVGRKKEMIISGGENIYPAELENVLAECEDIAEAAVIGRSDARWGEIAVAVVVPKSGRRPSADDILKLFDGRLARYKHPKDVLFVGELPKTALGKIRKEELRQMVLRIPVA